MDIQYIGENLLFGKIGHLLVITAFVSSILACIAFGIATNARLITNKKEWNIFGKWLFGLHSITFISSILLLFYILFSHRFEYQYVWQHSSKELPWYYIFSCFWEGQEGSFILWTFWHIVLAWILIEQNNKHESPAMSVIALVQCILTSMILGVYIFDIKIGSSPFMLLRDTMPNAPIFNKANYLELINGNGLNPLLQNYWMTIHPPTLFLGFASVLIPFALTVAALWTRDFKEIIKGLLTWGLWALFILGLGILMGSAWAYEALSFGGYWAWDPVENASFVPWLTLAAGVHTAVIYKHTKQALKATFLFYIFSFFLILYSTFLTRSGILGDTSVHSFTDLGMSGQLIILVILITLPALFLIILRWNSVPTDSKEESAYSREFWMFMGALILLFSSLLITFTTSIPVWNYFLKLVGIKELAPPLNPIEHYNKYQLVIAFFLAIGAGLVQFLRYKQNKVSNFLKPLLLPTILSFLISAVIIYLTQLYHWSFITLIVLSTFAVLANLGYIIQVLRGKVHVAGGSVTHIGFGIMLIGILISSANKEVISINTMDINYGKNFDEKARRENILLAKELPFDMGNYRLTYIDDYTEGVNNFYKIKFEKTEKDKSISETFFLNPHVQINPRMGMVSNPSTKHYLTKDIFTQITSVPDKSKTNEDTTGFKKYILSKGDTIPLRNSLVIFNGINTNIQSNKYTPAVGDIAAQAVLKITNSIDSAYCEPIFYIRNNFIFSLPDTVSKFSVEARFSRILPDTKQIEIELRENTKIKDYVILKATVFPMINLFWLGSVLMLIGICMSLIRRKLERKKQGL